MTIDHWGQILDMPCSSDGGTARHEDVVAPTHISGEVTHIITRSTPSLGTCSPSRKVRKDTGTLARYVSSPLYTGVTITHYVQGHQVFAPTRSAVIDMNPPRVGAISTTTDHRGRILDTPSSAGSSNSESEKFMALGTRGQPVGYYTYPVNHQSLFTQNYSTPGT